MPELRPRDQVEIERHAFVDDGVIPNNPRFPLLVYRGALNGGGDVAQTLEEAFARNDWRGGWRNGVYPFHHFHSDAHEVLGVAQGAARVRFGGENGASVEMMAGDVIVVPAGVGHKREWASDDLLIVGAYPQGRAPDLRRGAPDEHDEAAANVARTGAPAADPLYGPDGPLTEIWRRT